MIYYIAFFLISLILVIVHFLLFILNHRSLSLNSDVHMPTALLICSWLTCSVSCILSAALILLKTGERLWGAVVGLDFISFTFLIIEYSMQINCSNDTFIVKCLFRKPRSYLYSEIQYVTLGVNGSFTIQVNGRHIQIDQLMTGRYEFLEWIDEAFCKSTGALLDVEEPTLFHGNINNPGELLFGLLLVPVTITLGFGYLLCDGYSNLKASDSLESLEVKIVDYYEDDDSNYLFLITDSGTLVVINELLNQQDTLIQEIQQNICFSAEIGSWYTKEDEQRSNVWSLTDPVGNVFVDKNDRINYMAENSFRIWRVVGVMFLLSWLYAIFGIYFLNHAAEHPHLVRLFVKKEYLNI